MSESFFEHAVNNDSRRVIMNVAECNIFKGRYSGVYSLDVNLQGVQVSLLMVLMKETTDVGRGTINTHGQPFPQPTSQTDFETSGYNSGTMDAYEGRTDNQTTADDPLSNAANTGHPNSPPQSIGDINGGYTGQDNRKINRNIT
ncbi:hypothetical protein K435DRAFT_870959 [Dendrothele bispora CBS 962.96]|uniref:Uncharacterized protein n=1 Tax=Dendrothele bispora (strain CBS 962.96) TaxID=1314807 RepID=A0A4S8L5B4_DENBC|nr:hypothetical protein K435DRAFT_870959 [Dendrothele bispora CBS 962.96]